MKRLFIIGATLFVLTGCSGVETEVSTEAATEITTEVETEEVTTEEIMTEEIVTNEKIEKSMEDFPEGYSNYSKEYIEELYYNTIDKVVTLKEWQELEQNYYWNDTVIMYALLQKYGEIR